MADPAAAALPLRPLPAASVRPARGVLRRPAPAPSSAAAAAAVAAAVVGGTAKPRGVRFSLPEDTIGARDALRAGEGLVVPAAWDRAAVGPDVLTSYIKLCEAKSIPPMDSCIKQLKPSTNGRAILAIELAGVSLGRRAVSILTDVIVMCSKLKTLMLPLTNIDDTQIRSVLQAVLFHNRLQSLNIGYNYRVTATGVRFVSDFLVKCPTLVFLDMSGILIDRRCAQLLGEGLASPLCMLQVLRLNSCGMKPPSLEALAKPIRQSRVQVLALRRNHLPAAAGTPLAEMLAGNGALRRLDLRQNDLRDDGVRAIADALATSNTALYALLLATNDIHGAGLEALAVCLSRNRTLLELDLAYNPVGQANAALVPSPQVAALRNTLFSNQQLEVLRLGATGVTSEGAIAIAEVLPENKALRIVDLSDNALDVAGLLALSVSMRHNKTLCELTVTAPTAPAPPAAVEDPDPAQASHEHAQHAVRDLAALCEANQRASQWSPRQLTTLARLAGYIPAVAVSFRGNPTYGVSNVDATAAAQDGPNYPAETPSIVDGLVATTAGQSSSNVLGSASGPPPAASLASSAVPGSRPPDLAALQEQADLGELRAQALMRAVDDALAAAVAMASAAATPSPPAPLSDAGLGPDAPPRPAAAVALDADTAFAMDPAPPTDRATSSRQRLLHQCGESQMVLAQALLIVVPPALHGRGGGGDTATLDRVHGQVTAALAHYAALLNPATFVAAKVETEANAEAAQSLSSAGLDEGQAPPATAGDDGQPAAAVATDDAVDPLDSLELQPAGPSSESISDLLQFPTPTRNRRSQVVVDEADKLNIRLALATARAASQAGAGPPEADPATTSFEALLLLAARSLQNVDETDGAAAADDARADHANDDGDEDDQDDDDGDDIGDFDEEFESSPLRVDSPLMTPKAPAVVAIPAANEALEQPLARPDLGEPSAERDTPSTTSLASSSSSLPPPPLPARMSTLPVEPPAETLGASAFSTVPPPLPARTSTTSSLPADPPAETLAASTSWTVPPPLPARTSTSTAVSLPVDVPADTLAASVPSSSPSDPTALVAALGVNGLGPPPPVSAVPATLASEPPPGQAPSQASAPTLDPVKE